MLNAAWKVQALKYEPAYSKFVEKFLEDLYVDDATSGANTVTEGKKFYDLPKSIMLEAGFDLRKWVTPTCKNILIRRKIYFLRIIVLKRTMITLF